MHSVKGGTKFQCTAETTKHQPPPPINNDRSLIGLIQSNDVALCTMLYIQELMIQLEIFVLLFTGVVCLPKQGRGLTPPWRGRGYSDVLNDGGGGVNKGSEFYKFRPLGKKKCYCYAKRSGVGKHFSGTI